MPDLVLVRHSTAAAAPVEPSGATSAGGGSVDGAPAAAGALAPLPGGDDAARPLTAGGRERAAGTARWLAARVPEAGVVLVSAALRTQQTWQLLAQRVGAGEVRVLEDLYTASPQQVVHLLASLDASVTSAVVVGHEPVMSVTAHALTGRPVGFSPGTAAVLRVPSWEGLGGGTAELGEVHRPR